MRYQYWTLRYLPDAARGEFVNIGIVVGRDGADWSIRLINSFARASRIGGDLGQAKRWAQSLEEMISEYRNPTQLPYQSISEAKIYEMTAFHNNLVQISDPGPVVADTADTAVDLLFQRLVGDPDSLSRNNSRSRAINQLSEAYKERRSELALHNKVKVRSGIQSMDFDFALTGTRIEHLSRVWAFDLQNMDTQVDRVQAWGFRVENLRQDGGELDIGTGQALAVDPEVPVKVLYVPPRNTIGEEKLEIARDAWDRIGAQSYPLERARELVMN